jgi:hypothetical protein
MDHTSVILRSLVAMCAILWSFVATCVILRSLECTLMVDEPMGLRDLIFLGGNNESTKVDEANVDTPSVWNHLDNGFKDRKLEQISSHET